MTNQGSKVPEHSQILVIGGGPAGAYSATVLAREGFTVTLLEKDLFPRYHIGESLLPSCRQYLRFIGVEERVKAHGFTHKPGAAVKLNQFKREGYTDFISLNPNNGAWNVVRSEFDAILLRHAQDCGVNVFQETAVTEIHFGEDKETPVSALWCSKDTNLTGRICFDWLIDASGKTGIMSTKYLRSRAFNKSLRNIALWGYWTGAGIYCPGTERENAPWFEALTDESGWAWFIPLHNGTVSVGIVMGEHLHKSKKIKFKEVSGESSVTPYYISQLELAPGLIKLLGDAKLDSEIKSAGDYSYYSPIHAGPRYRIAGDAGAFIDPFFSSGIHLAFTGALSAAASIAASIRGQCTEPEAMAYHNAKVGASYTRFLIVVLGIYKQIRAQSWPVLSEVDEDNFDRAFSALRPVIQGTADAVPRLSEKELQDTMDFCKNVFAPTSPEMYKSVGERVDPSLMAENGPILDVETIDKIVGSDDEAKYVLWEVNARKPIHVMYDAPAHFVGEVQAGFSVSMERGNLGLCRA
ncbi:putative halogenase [Neolentinus lepideus HHB14362 ss-1]|uniref:Putative halogenase n=1 Tax=Neolentinus lepideus HHB14362 ss-1 TaxID=1314782 RepID=A0A165ULS1_9AGAM|nr:putative halogenase [Neolentinus lepideus HHB14362 ss-1]